ncbi:MAG TPA: TIR domain-containing protein [Caulobacteraceae bacterium]|jgi:hypothetical protein|nr:TIR domain-containing protein [Caulobacteraceae bacterium]
MTHDVFICHSSKDKTIADAACATLEQRGVRCWVAPRDVMPGASWAASIVSAIEGSKLMLLIFSENANDSPQIEREIERAVDHRVPIVPFRIADILPTEALEYFISTSHWLDAYSPPIDRHYQTLADKIETILATQTHQAGAPDASPAAPPHHEEPPPPPPPPPVAARGAGPWPLVLAAGAVAVAVLAVGALLAVTLGSRPPPASASAAAAGAAASGATPLVFQSYPINLDPHGDNWIALRSEPDGLGIRLDKLGPRAQFAVVERQGEWSRVQLPDGRAGWVSSHYIGCCRAAAAN